MNLLQNFHLAVIKYLYRGRRAVPLQTLATRHTCSNRKLSIVMALSTTFTQCAPETTKFGKITQNKGHFAVQGNSRSPILVPIESSYATSYYWLILTCLLSCIAPFRIYSIPNVENRYIWLPLLRLNPLTAEFPWDDLRKILRGCQWMAKPTKRRRKIAENFNRLNTAHVRYRRQTYRWQTERR